MNTILRRILLGLLALLAIFVGFWAAAFPAAFYSSFPGFGQRWISSDGPIISLAVDLILGLVLILPGRAASAPMMKSAGATR
jgi:hypothetical protein